MTNSHIVLLRHGEAVTFDRGGDRNRALTERGVADICASAAVFNRWSKAASQKSYRVLYSPYLRTRQSALHFTSAIDYSPLGLEEVDWLVPTAAPMTTARALTDYADRDEADIIVAITHQPLISELYSYFSMGSCSGGNGFSLGKPLMPASMVCMIADVAGPGCFEVQAEHHPYES